MLITFMFYCLASESASSWPVTWDLLLHTHTCYTNLHWKCQF